MPRGAPKAKGGAPRAKRRAVEEEEEEGNGDDQGEGGGDGGGGDGGEDPVPPAQGTVHVALTSTKFQQDKLRPRQRALSPHPILSRAMAADAADVAAVVAAEAVEVEVEVEVVVVAMTKPEGLGTPLHGR